MGSTEIAFAAALCALCFALSLARIGFAAPRLARLNAQDRAKHGEARQ